MMRKYSFSIHKVQFWLWIPLPCSFQRALAKLCNNKRSGTNVSGRGVGEPRPFVLIWIMLSSLVLELNYLLALAPVPPRPARLCLGSGVKLQAHQLRSRALPNLCPVCHLTFYLSHFQFLSSEQTYTYPMIGHRHNQVMFVHSFLLLRPAFKKISTFYFWIVDKECKFVQVNFVFSADHCSLVELPVL